MPTKLTCFACSTITECECCGQEVEVEGITYDLLDYDLEIQGEAVIHGTCPECGSHRTEW
jgi:hypothetical protein